MIQLVTPKQAKEWLKDAHQTYVEWRKILKLSEEEWDVKKQKGHPVIIKRGAVQDGHHRIFLIAITGEAREVEIEYRDF